MICAQRTSARILWAKFMLLLVFSLIALPAASAAQPVAHQYDIGSGIDVSGLIILEKSDGGGTFLVVHDSKQPGQPRLGIVRVSNDQPLTYSPISWPESSEEPVDVESLSRHPDGDSYILMTSRGEGVHFQLSDDQSSINVLDEFLLPTGLSLFPEIEGFTLQTVEGDLYAVWGNRGQNEDPAILNWAVIDLNDYRIGEVCTSTFHVPWPDQPEVRHLSELRVTDDGLVYVTSARDAGNEGPFAGALFRVGRFETSASDGLVFLKNEPLELLLRTETHKLEAFDFLASPSSGIALASDDEYFGSTLFLTW